MNGTQFDAQIEMIKQFNELQYDDISAFCQIVFVNKSFAFKSTVSYYKVTKLKELADVLESKIREEIYDEQALQIARELLEEEENYFLDHIIARKVKFEKSVRNQIAKYRWAARALKLTQQFLQIAVIVGAASVPLILSNPTSPREISTYISIVVAVSAALLKFYRFQDNINFNHTAAERMQLEYNLYSSQRGVYMDLGFGAALDRFMNEIDKLRQETNELSLSLGKIAQDQIQDQLLRVSKSISEIHHVNDAH